MSILNTSISDDLEPARKGGVTFYPASELNRIFAWAIENERTVEWVEGLFYRPATREGELSVAYIRERRGADHSVFRQVCLDLAKALENEAVSKGMGGYFEIGISDG